MAVMLPGRRPMHSESLAHHIAAPLAAIAVRLRPARRLCSQLAARLRPARRPCGPLAALSSPLAARLRPARRPCSPLAARLRPAHRSSARSPPLQPARHPYGPLAALPARLLPAPAAASAVRRSAGRPSGAPPCLTLRAALLVARHPALPAMASLSVLTFDHEGPSLAPPTPLATADSATRSQWLTRDVAARLAVRNHLPLAERAHSGQRKTAKALYDVVFARYSSPATAALGRLLLPYLFPELFAFATVEDLVTHLHTSDARYRAALSAEFLDRNLPPMYITLYFIVTHLPDSLRTVLQRFGFRYSSPQSTPLPTGHSFSAPPSDESVEPSGPYAGLVGCLMYLMTCTRPDLAYPLSILARYVAPRRHRPEHCEAANRVLRYLCSMSGMGLVLGGRGPVVLTGHAGASWVYDLATQRSSQGYTFSLGSGSVSWRSTRSSSILKQPRSSPVLYVDNKAMIALCEEHRLEHRLKHIALRYFPARELQQRGQLRLAYVATRANTADIFTKALQSGVDVAAAPATSAARATEEGEGGGCGGGGNVPEGTCPRPPLYSLSLQRLSLWGKGGGVRGWRERFCRASSRPSSSLSHSRACHCGGEGEAVAKVSQASAAAARCYRGTSNCRPYLHLLFLLLSAAVEWQVLPLSSAVPPPLFAARSCSPGGLLPYASTSAASTLAEGLVQLNLPPLHRLPLLLPAVAAFSALGVPLQEVYCIRFQL
ncbi:unnamed protein product [Closterium sp. NIES-54]